MFEGTACGEGVFYPDDPAKRWELAVWLVRVVDGETPDSVTTSTFTDVDVGQWWAPFVERLAELELAPHCESDPARFCPEDPMSRAETAALLQGIFGLPDAPSAGFTDISEDPRASSIDALAAEGIVDGCDTDLLRFCPNDAATRVKMASFLARAMGLVLAAPAFSAVSAGGEHTCGLRVGGAIKCWGSDRFGQLDAPEGVFSAVSAGSSHSCGVRLDGSAVCWGNTRDGRFGQADAPDGLFSSVSAGQWHTCGLRTDARAVCWGHNAHGEANARGERYTAVAAGADYGQSDVPEGTFVAILAGATQTCGLRANGVVACWGENPMKSA